MTRFFPLLLLLGCEGWPSAANLPTSCADDPDCVEGGVDPRELVEIAWLPVAEADPNQLLDDTTNREQSLASGAGVQIQGGLDGLGWDNTSPAEEVFGCDPYEPRLIEHPAGDGYYARDVDWFRIAPEADGTLCATVSFDGATGAGLDLLLFPLDTCGIPLATVSGANGPLGFGAPGGEPIEWSANVFSDVTYGVLLAGFHGPEPEPTYGYQAAFSLVPRAADDGPGLCPIP